VWDFLERASKRSLDLKMWERENEETNCKHCGRRVVRDTKNESDINNL